MPTAYLIGAATAWFEDQNASMTAATRLTLPSLPQSAMMPGRVPSRIFRS